VRGQPFRNEVNRVRQRQQTALWSPCAQTKQRSHAASWRLCTFTICPERQRLRAQPRPLDRGVECRHLGVGLAVRTADPAHDALVLEGIDIDFSIERQVVLIYAKRGHGQLRSSTDVGDPAATNMISQL
jgi:hypothetical protein